MEIAGYFLMAIIGVSLGMIGAGGSILTVPVLVYFFSLSPFVAQRHAMFVVGACSFISTGPKWAAKEVLPAIALPFSLISGLEIYLVKILIQPHMPAVLGHLGAFTIRYEWLSMVVFAVIMIWASNQMILEQQKSTRISDPDAATFRLTLCAAVTGMITGFLGVGGGFLVIPALTLYLGIDIKKAVGTSLLIITINTLIGFGLEASHAEVNWQMLIIFSMIAIAGSFVGNLLAKKVNAAFLKKIFGWTVMFLGFMILLGQFIKLFGMG